VYLAYKYQGRYNIQAAKNRLSLVKDPVNITLIANKYLFIKELNNYKHLMLRKWLLAVLSDATAYIPKQELILDIIRCLQT
jgi:hypothetical protein